MRRFDYSFLADTLPMPMETLRDYASIVRIETRLDERLKELNKRLEPCRRTAMYKSVVYSNAIEGIVLPDGESKALFEGKKVPCTHDEFNFMGYVNVLRRMDDELRHLDLNEETMLSLYKTLMEGTDVEHAFKKADNCIVSTDGLGNRKIIFRPTSASESEEALEQMKLAYLDARDQLGVPELLLIPCVILDFLCIHPFMDGNGRMSRILTDLMLRKAGFSVARYVSLDEAIYLNRDRYYGELASASSLWHEEKTDYMAFVSYMLRLIANAYRQLDRRMEAVSGFRSDIEARVYAEICLSRYDISKKEILANDIELNETSVEAALSRLQKQGKIRKIGSKVNAKYTALLSEK